MAKIITLTQGKSTIVDDADYQWLNQWKWCARKARDRDVWYALRTAGRKPYRRIVLMHRLILNIDGKTKIKGDHIDGDGLNNQRENLRKATHTENGHNRRVDRDNKTGYKGVVKEKDYNRWRASITVNGHALYLGMFKSPEEAARAYDEAATKYYGEFAWLNFSKDT